MVQKGATDAKGPKRAAGPSVYVKYYLVAYNVLSALGWSYILVTTVLHLAGITASSRQSVATSQTATSTLSRLVASIPYFKPTAPTAGTLHARVPTWLLPLYTRAMTTYATVGPTTALVQSCAALEVLHAALGWVRSPLQTTAMQVASRLFIVWGVTEQFEVARTNPLYATMVLSWSLTEVVRYAYYAANLLGHEPYPLVYARYTTFYILYPLGASSEAFVNYSTLPATSPIPSFRTWLRGMWMPADYIRGVLFLVWWPALYLLYTYMIKQRQKVLGKGTGHHKLVDKPKKL